MPPSPFSPQPALGCTHASLMDSVSAEVTSDQETAHQGSRLGCDMFGLHNIYAVVTLYQEQKLHVLELALFLRASAGAKCR